MRNQVVTTVGRELPTQHGRFRRAGVTRLEVGVGLLMGFLVAGLVILWTAKARVTRQRVQCEFNLKRQGDALRGYHDLRGQIAALPPAHVAEHYGTWAALLGPYLGDHLTLARWKDHLSYFDQEQAVRETQLPLFYCPERPRESYLSVEGDEHPLSRQHVAGAVGDYAAAAGDGVTPWNGAFRPALVQGDMAGGKFTWLSVISLDELPRGQQATLLLGEKFVPSAALGQGTLRDGALYHAGKELSHVREVGPEHPLAPRDTLRHDLFGSTHPHVVYFLYADLSVRGLARDTSPSVLGRQAKLKE